MENSRCDQYDKKNQSRRSFPSLASLGKSLNSITVYFHGRKTSTLKKSWSSVKISQLVSGKAKRFCFYWSSTVVLTSLQRGLKWIQFVQVPHGDKWQYLGRRGRFLDNNYLGNLFGQKCWMTLSILQTGRADVGREHGEDKLNLHSYRNKTAKSAGWLSGSDGAVAIV